MGRAQHAVARGQLTQQRTREGPEHQPGNAEEHADHGADAGAPQRARTGAYALGTQRAGREIDDYPDRADRADGQQPPQPQVAIAVHRRGQPDPAEHHRNARQHRQHRAGQPAEHQQGGEDVEGDVEHGRSCDG